MKIRRIITSLLRATFLIFTLSHCTHQNISPVVPKESFSIKPPLDLSLPFDEPVLPKPLIPPKQLEFQLENGMKVIIIDQPKQLTTHIRFVIKSGYSQSDRLARYIQKLWEFGSQKTPGQAFSKAVAQTGNDFSYFVNSDSSIISTTLLPDDLDIALHLLAENILYPNFTEQTIEATKTRLLLDYKAMNSISTMLAEEAFKQVLYGREHPYGTPKPSSQALSETTAQEVKNYYESHYLPSNSALILSGSIRDIDETIKRVKNIFSAWEVKESTPSTLQTNLAPNTQQEAIYIIDREDAAQTDIFVGFVTVSKTHKDWIQLHFLSTLLGGGTHSRLFHDIREERGLAYSIRSNQRSQKLASPFFVRTNTANTKVAASLKGILQHFSHLSQHEVSNKELELNKRFLLGRLVFNFETHQQIAHRAGRYFVLNLPSAFYQRYAQEVESLTSQQLLSISKKYFSKIPTIVIVGDYSVIKHQISTYFPTYKVYQYKNNLEEITSIAP